MRILKLVIFVTLGSNKNPKIIPAAIREIEEIEEPVIVGYSVEYSRNEKSLDLNKLPELNQVRKDRKYFVLNCKEK